MPNEATDYENARRLVKCIKRTFWAGQTGPIWPISTNRAVRSPCRRRLPCPSESASGFREPSFDRVGPLSRSLPMNPANIQQPTADAQHPVTQKRPAIGCSRLEVGGWMFLGCGSGAQCARPAFRRILSPAKGERVPKAGEGLVHGPDARWETGEATSQATWAKRPHARDV